VIELLAVVAGQLTFPVVAAAAEGEGEEPISQLIVGSQPVTVGAFPSQISMKTELIGTQPVPATGNGTGAPEEFSGTVNGLVDGLVIEPAAEAADAKAQLHNPATSARPATILIKPYRPTKGTVRVIVNGRAGSAPGSGSTQPAAE
jgi:hypothetical protein